MNRRGSTDQSQPRRLLGYGSIYAVTRVLSAAIAAGGSVASFTLAGAADFGLFSALIVTTSLAGGFASGWFAQSILRFGVPEESWISHLRTSRPRIKVGISVLVAGAVALSQATTLPILEQIKLVAAAIVSLFFFSLAAIAIAAAQSQLRALRAGLIEMFRAAGMTIPPAAIALTSAETTPTAMLLTSSAILAVGLLLFWRGAGAEGSSNATFAARWTYGWPLGLWIMLSGLYQFSDRVLLTWLDTLDTAGVYSVLYDITNRGLVFPLVAVGTAANPLVFKLYQAGDRLGARQLNARTISIQVISAVVIAGAAIVLIWPFRSTHFPWVGATEVVVIALLYLSGVLWTLSTSIQRIQQGEGTTGPLLKRLAWSTAVNTVLNLALIPIWGGLGAALSTFAATVMYLVSIVAVRPNTPTVDLKAGM